jgi:chromosome partitioning protein
LSHEIAEEIRSHFPADTFKSVIPRSVRLSESPSHGLAVLEYDTKSAGAVGYRALAAEVIRRREPDAAEVGAGGEAIAGEESGAEKASRFARLFGRR